MLIVSIGAIVPKLARNLHLFHKFHKFHKLHTSNIEKSTSVECGKYDIVT